MSVPGITVCGPDLAEIDRDRPPAPPRSRASAIAGPGRLDDGLAAARAAVECERVVAAAADQRVVARAADQGVAAARADQRVVAGSALEDDARPRSPRHRG